jgi:hypothetical protein
MNPNLYEAPLSDPVVDDIINKDGVLENLPLLDLDLPDERIVQTLHTRIQNSLDYFNDKTGFNLHDVRVKNLNAFKGDHAQLNPLYTYDDTWTDNEIYVGVDAIVAYTTAETSRSEVYPASGSPESKIFAVDLEKYHYAHSKRFFLAKKVEASILNLLTQQLGVIKLVWDPNYGKTGEILPKIVNPSHYFVDKNAKLDEIPEFEGEVLKDSVEGLIARFPKKERDIMNLFGIKRKGAQNISKEIAYREVWFTYYDDNNKPQQAVAWYVNRLVLDKKRNPNWLYEDEGENFLDTPARPYVRFNLINDGEHAIDLTGPLAQALSMQSNLNIEGQQVVENLRTANGSKLVAASAMTTDQMEDWDDKPNQTIALKLKQGQTINDVAKQFEPHIVSQELVNDKMDSRNTVHGILGTPSQFRGDDTDQTKTASEAALIKNQASGRQDKIIRAIDYAMDKYYNLLTQMMLVYYSESHYRTVNGGDGNFDHIEMHRNKIESGMTVTVQAGTTLAFDKARQEAVAQNAAELGLLAPYDYYRLMHMEQPQKLYDNLMKWKTNPQQLAVDLGNEEEDHDAIIDFTELINGRAAEQREDITPAYIEQFRKKMITDQFLSANKKNQQKVINFVLKAAEALALRTAIDQASSQPEPPEPLPSQVDKTMLPMPAVNQPGGAMPPVMPGAPMMPQAAPPAGLLPAAAAPGIQGVMQMAQQPAPQPAAPNLNPSQPMPPQTVASLPPM